MKISKNKRIHIIGIGGIGMSGIAEILHGLGYKVQGSDVNLNANIIRLNQRKIKTFIGHSINNMKNVDLLVYSSAISKNNAERKFALKNKIPSISRANILSQLVKLKKTIAISGSHGKTTTTSLISSILGASKLKPTVINGGIINDYGTNTKLGNGEWMIVEADESDGTFVKLQSTISVVTNIDKEHLDFYNNFQNLRNKFEKFINQVPFYGVAVICNDDENLRKIIKKNTSTNIITYGCKISSDIQGKNIKYLRTGVCFDAIIKNKNKIIKNIQLPLYGEYNINNALAAIAVATNLNLNFLDIKKALSKFSGVQRRLTVRWQNEYIKIIDDYAHHPTEISNVIRGLKKSRLTNKIIVIFQPHRYSRLNNLKNEFAKCFCECDHVMISDVYAAGEKKPINFDLRKITEKITKNSKVKVSYYSNNEDLFQFISIKKSETIFLFLGAGTVTEWAKDFSRDIKNIYE